MTDLERIGRYIHRLHIKDTHAFHPGGTNIYFVGDPATEMTLVDTGEQDREWTRLILEAYRALGEPKIAAILITHGHVDHVGGLDRIHEVMRAPVRCHPKLVEKLVPCLGYGVGDEAPLPRAHRRRRRRRPRSPLHPRGMPKTTPATSSTAEKIALTGDTILGSSTSVVQDLASYMKSLALIERFKPRVICPAHGKIVRNAPEWVAGYIKHRNLRERQVLGALKEGLGDADEIVRRIYPKNLKKALRQAAAGNVRQHLAKLQKDGLIGRGPGPLRRGGLGLPQASPP